MKKQIFVTWAAIAVVLLSVGGIAAQHDKKMKMQDKKMDRSNKKKM